jgi:O-methyltransferase domain
MIKGAHHLSHQIQATQAFSRPRPSRSYGKPTEEIDMTAQPMTLDIDVVKSVDTIVQLSIDAFASKSLHLIGDLGIADLLGDEPKLIAELAQATGSNADALTRVLRLLESYGIFKLHGRLVEHTPTSKMLRLDHPQSMRTATRLFGLPSVWDICNGLDYSVKTGRPSTENIMPGGWWQHLSEHPDEARIFGESMYAWAQTRIPGILNAYDFSRFERIADLGGGHGQLIGAILQATPTTQGIIFDLPTMAGMAPPAERLTFQAGNFFEDTLPKCGGYLLMQVLHDFSDEECIKLLQAVRRDAPAGAKVLVLETPLPEGPGNHWLKKFDLLILTILGGRERTTAEYAALFTAAGLKFEREIDTRAGVSIFEASV